MLERPLRLDFILKVLDKVQCWANKLRLTSNRKHINIPRAVFTPPSLLWQWSMKVFLKREKIDLFLKIVIPFAAVFK